MMESDFPPLKDGGRSGPDSMILEDGSTVNFQPSCDDLEPSLLAGKEEVSFALVKGVLQWIHSGTLPVLRAILVD